MQDKKRVENFWREPPRGLFIHFVLLIKKRRLKSSQKSLTFWGHYTQAAGVHRYLRKVNFYPLTASSLALTYLRTVLLWKNNEINAIGVAIIYLMASIIIVRITNENICDQISFFIFIL